MGQTPAIAWDTSPDNMEPLAGELEQTTVAVEAKTEDFGALVERKASEQILTIRMSTDQTRLNEAVGKRVAELVAELGLPPPLTEEKTIDMLAGGKVDEFENVRLNFLASEKARDIFYDRHPEMRTQNKQQNIQEATQAMSQALMESFLRFLRDAHTAEQRREHREAQKVKKA